MRKVLSFSSWVVYRLNVEGKPTGPSGVCGQEEWAAMEANQPGQYSLVRGGIASEREAEQAARGTAADTFNSRSARRA